MATRHPTPLHTFKNPRFVKEDGWRLRDISINWCNTIAVCGVNETKRKTSIDLYCQGSFRDLSFRDTVKPLYSKEFEPYSSNGRSYWVRLVSFSTLDTDTIVTCIGKKLDLIRISKDEVLQSCLLNSVGSSLCVSQNKVFISFRQSNKVGVYDVGDLRGISLIELHGIEDGDIPTDMTVASERIFIRIYNQGTKTEKSLEFYEHSGTIVSEFRNDLGFTGSRSIAVNDEIGIVAVVWSDSQNIGRGVWQISVYSMMLRTTLFNVAVESGVSRIRISAGGDKIITGNERTGEIKIYDMADLYTYGHLRKKLETEIQKCDCLRLKTYFPLSQDQSHSIDVSSSPSEDLILSLEENGFVHSSNVNRLIKAFFEMNLTSCHNIAEIYQRTRTLAFYTGIINKQNEEIKMIRNTSEEENRQLRVKLETKIQDAQILKKEVQNLQRQLKEANLEITETKKRFEQLRQSHEETKKFLHETERVRDTFKSELAQFRLQHAKNQWEGDEPKPKLTETGRRPQKITEDEALMRPEDNRLQRSMKSRDVERLGELTSLAQPYKMEGTETEVVSSGVPQDDPRYLPESLIKSQYGKLTVTIAENLTLDHCVSLATLFAFPPAKIDLLRNVSGRELPGIKLLEIATTSNVINQYDVSNLQNALNLLHIEKVNENLVVPYQRKIDPQKREEHKPQNILPF